MDFGIQLSSHPSSCFYVARRAFLTSRGDNGSGSVQNFVEHDRVLWTSFSFNFSGWARSAHFVHNHAHPVSPFVRMTDFSYFPFFLFCAGYAKGYQVIGVHKKLATYQPNVPNLARALRIPITQWIWDVLTIDLGSFTAVWFVHQCWTTTSCLFLPSGLDHEWACLSWADSWVPLHFQVTSVWLLLGQGAFHFFHTWGTMYHLSYTEFALFLGLYTQDYTLIQEYRNFTFYYPPGEPLNTRWLRLSDCNHPFYLSVTEATLLKSRALCFVHALLSDTLTSRNHSTGNISLLEFHYIMSMQTWVPLQMGFVVATSL